MGKNIGLLWVIATIFFAMRTGVIYAHDAHSSSATEASDVTEMTGERGVKTYESQLLDEIDERVEKEEYYEAVKDLSELIADWPESKEAIAAWLKMASVYLKLGEYKKASEAASKAKEMLDESNFDWQHDEADQCFAQALKFCTRTSTAGDFDRAREILNSVIEKFPDTLHHARALNRIGCSYIHQQLYEKAIEELQRVIEKFPNTNQSVRAMRWIGKDYLLNKKYDESIKECQKIIKGWKESKDLGVAKVYDIQAPWAQYLIAQNYHRQQKYDQAIVEYQRLTEMYPEHPLKWHAVIEKGRCLYFSKLYKEAIGEFQKIVDNCKKSKFLDSASQNIKDINQILERQAGTK